MSDLDGLAALSRRLASHRRALERSEQVDPGSLDELSASIERQVRQALGRGTAAPRDLLILLDEAEALRAALERAHRSAQASIDMGERRQRGRAAYRSAPGT